MSPSKNSFALKKASGLILVRKGCVHKPHAIEETAISLVTYHECLEHIFEQTQYIVPIYIRLF